MKNKAKHTLITAEILGFFLIIIGILAIMTERYVFEIAAFLLFFLIVLVTAMFVTFFILHTKQEKGKLQIKFKKAH